MSIINYMPSGGINIDGLIEEYYVYAGQNINAGSFVEFVNGVSGVTTKTSTVVKYASSVSNPTAVEISTDKVFISYINISARSLQAIVCSVSDIAITYGSAITLHTDCLSATVNAAKADTNKAVVFTEIMSEMFAYVCSVSGTTITSGNVINISPSSTYNYDYARITDAGTNKVVMLFSESSSSTNLRAIVASVSGTGMSQGSKVTFSNDTTSNVNAALINTNKIVVTFDQSNNKKCYARVGSISGTSISFGNNAEYNNGKSYYNSNALCKVDTDKFLVQYYNNNTANSSLKVATVSNTTISFGTEYVPGEGNIEYVNTCYLSSNKILISYRGKNYIVSVSGTSVTFGPEYTHYAGTTKFCLIRENTLFLTYSSSGGNAKIIRVSGNTISDQWSTTNYETQVRNTTKDTPNGVAKTSGTGGTSTAHKDKINIYVPNI